MQAAIIPLSVNLDKVLEKLNGTSKDRKIRRKDMENIFDDIVKGEAGKTLYFYFNPENLSLLDLRLYVLSNFCFYLINSYLPMYYSGFLHAFFRMDGKIEQLGEMK